MLRQFKFAAIALGALILGSGSATATSVPAGTLTISPFFNPVVSLTANTVMLASGSGSHAFNFFGGSGQFTTADSTVSFAFGSTSSSTLSFNPTVGNVVSYSANNLNNLFVFTDVVTGEIYDFNLDQSITTVTDGPTGSGTEISLRLLGDLTATGTTVYNTSTPTALTLSLNQTGGSAWSLTGTLANPPPPDTGLPVPEPTSIALLGGGLAALGFVRHRQRKQ